MAAQRRSSIEQEIDRHVAEWTAAGLVQETDWDGQPLLITKLPSGRDVFFDPAAVERVLRFFLLLRQLIGRWNNKPFILLDWQVRYFIAPVFGIRYRSTGYRVIRTVWFEIPRKNGKSTLCSGVGLYLFAADREPGAQVYAAAGDRNQAGLVFNPSRLMALASPELMKRLGKKGVQRALLEHPITHAIFRALSSEGARQHGLNVHGAMIDEVHVHKNPDLIDALETGTGSREQPLIVFITTADDGVDGSVYATKREYLEGIVGGHFKDRSFYGCVFGVDHTVPGFDPFADETLRAANPGADITVMMDYLRNKAAEAQSSPAQLNRYLRLHLNVRTKQTVRWLPLDRWDVTGQLIGDDEWAGQTAYGGLDLSSSLDFTAFALRAGNMAHVLFWLPEGNAPYIEQLTNAPISLWNRQGFIRFTEGDVVDYAQVRHDIEAEIARLGCSVASIGYDPYNATETVQLLGESGFNMVPVRQGYANLSAPSKSLERLVMGSTPKAPLLRTGSNPVLRWNADCVEVKTDDNGNVRPVKPNRLKSKKRIDGIVALIMAERERMAFEDETSDADDYFAAIAAKRAASNT